MLFTNSEVCIEKNFAQGLEMYGTQTFLAVKSPIEAAGRGLAFKTEGKVFLYTDRPRPVNNIVSPRGWGEGGTPIYKLYGYVPHFRVWFSSCFSLK